MEKVGRCMVIGNFLPSLLVDRSSDDIASAYLSFNKSTLMGNKSFKGSLAIADRKTLLFSF